MLFALLLLVSGLLLPARGAAEHLSANAALESINAAEAREYVGVLADDTFEGREAGSRGGRAAAIYLVQQLQKLGVPGGNRASGSNSDAAGGDAAGRGSGSYYQAFGTSSNLLALVEGSDPELKKQFVVVSAHYDHVGYGTRRTSFGPLGYIHHGADDNASGVAGLLEIIKAVRQLAQPPKRSILFAFWDGEEQGLLGSKHWLEHPTVPLKQVAVMANLDMIGRLRPAGVEVVGSRTARGLRRLVSEQNDGLGLPLTFSWEMKGNSDHYPFFARNIPVVMLHTGLHADYHRPSDVAEKINNEGLRQVAQLTFKVVLELADSPQAFDFRPASRDESPTSQKMVEQALPPLPGRLGLRLVRPAADGNEASATVDGRETQGIVIESVGPDSAAARAGLRAGDRIVEFNGRAVTSIEPFQAHVLAAVNPVLVAIERGEEKTPLAFHVELFGKPLRLGISWQADDAEPDSVLLTRVVPNSPADRAGLHVFDHVLRIDGHDFRTSQEFAKMAADVSGDITFTVEFAGRVRTATAHVPDAPQRVDGN